MGHESRSEEERFNDLQHYAALDYKAKSTVAETLYEGNFNQHRRSEEERFQDLKELALKDNSSALIYINTALTEGTLGQGIKTQEERFNELYSLRSLKDSMNIIRHSLEPLSLY